MIHLTTIHYPETACSENKYRGEHGQTKETGSEQGTNHDIKATSPNGLTAAKIHDKPDRQEHQLAIMHKLCFQVPTAL